MMDPLSSLDAIAELIRRRASETTLNKLDRTSSEKLTQAKQKHLVAKQMTSESVKLKIINAIKLINHQDAKKNQKIVKIFVENVLIWQFGEDLINDPSFIILVDEVSFAMLNEPSALNQLNMLAVS
jgi:hypothetical protein